MQKLFVLFLSLAALATFVASQNARESCLADIERLCGSVSEFELRDCMREHFEQLSIRCQEALRNESTLLPPMPPQNSTGEIDIIIVVGPNQPPQNSSTIHPTPHPHPPRNSSEGFPGSNSTSSNSSLPYPDGESFIAGQDSNGGEATSSNSESATEEERGFVIALGYYSLDFTTIALIVLILSSLCCCGVFFCCVKHNREGPRCCNRKINVLDKYGNVVPPRTAAASANGRPLAYAVLVEEVPQAIPVQTV